MNQCGDSRTRWPSRPRGVSVQCYHLSLPGSPSYDRVDVPLRGCHCRAHYGNAVFPELRMLDDRPAAMPAEFLVLLERGRDRWWEIAWQDSVTGLRPSRTIASGPSERLGTCSLGAPCQRAQPIVVFLLHRLSRERAPTRVRADCQLAAGQTSPERRYESAWTLQKARKLALQSNCVFRPNTDSVLKSLTCSGRSSS
jgi:hypothetical protein